MARHRPTDRPFSIIVCTSCQSARVFSALDALRATIKRCPHGMLVRATCLLDSLTCAYRPTGVMVVLQPCSVDRAPVGPAVWLGPIDGPGDLHALCDYIERGAWEFEEAPARLGGHRQWLAQSARTN